MMVLVAEGALYMAAKFDESGLATSFLDFHGSVSSLHTFSQMLFTAEVSVTDIFWLDEMYRDLERDILSILSWKIDQVTSADILVSLITLLSRLDIEKIS